MPADMAEYLTQDEVWACMDAVMGKGAADVALRVTVNVGVIRGGLKVNMMPGDCRVAADIRLPFGIDRNDVLGEIDTILHDGYPEARHRRDQRPQAGGHRRHRHINRAG